MSLGDNLEVHVVKEVASGVFSAVLDFPRKEALLPGLLESAFPYVLCWGHHVGCYRWEPFKVPVVDPQRPEEVLARAIDVDFVVATSRFKELLPDLGPGVCAVQLAQLPPDYLDLRKIKGKELWRQLNQVGWHVWVNIPGNDYAQIASPDRDVVARAIACVQNDA